MKKKMCVHFHYIFVVAQLTGRKLNDVRERKRKTVFIQSQTIVKSEESL